MDNLTARQIAEITNLNILMREIPFGTVIDTLITLANANEVKADANAATIALLDANVPEGTPVNSATASNILTLTDIVLDGELVVINEIDTYEFCADAAQTVTTEGNIAVDITASVTASSNTLTVDTQPTAGDTMTIEGKVYTFVPVGTDNADGEVSIGADLAGAQAAIIAAIMGTDAHNTVNAHVSIGAFAADDATITALIGGVAGYAIATTSSFTAGTNTFSAATLGSGADCTAANAITALVAAIVASDTQDVGAADGDGDTVNFTADTAGAPANAITTTTTMANASFATATLEGGVDETAGVLGQQYVDSSYLYTCVGANSWRRVSLGAEY